MSIWEQVIKDMEGREALGMSKYGKPLTPHDGRDSLKDAYEEALDLAVYLKKAMTERDTRQIWEIMDPALEKELFKLIKEGRLDDLPILPIGNQLVVSKRNKLHEVVEKLQGMTRSTYQPTAHLSPTPGLAETLPYPCALEAQIEAEAKQG